MDTKKISLFQKISYIFDRKQKVQLFFLGIMIFIGGFLETLGVGAMIPVVTALLTPDTLTEYVQKYRILQDLCDEIYTIQDGTIQAHTKKSDEWEFPDAT